MQLSDEPIWLSSSSFSAGAIATGPNWDLVNRRRSPSCNRVDGCVTIKGVLMLVSPKRCVRNSGYPLSRKHRAKARMVNPPARRRAHSRLLRGRVSAHALQRLAPGAIGPELVRRRQRPFDIGEAPLSPASRYRAARANRAPGRHRDAHRRGRRARERTAACRTDARGRSGRRRSAAHLRAISRRLLSSPFLQPSPLSMAGLVPADPRL